MALKTHFSEIEKFGLTKEEVKMGEKYLRKNKTAGAVADPEAIKLYELFMLGCSFTDIHNQYPQYLIPQIILTCALRGWTKDREKMMMSLRDRVRAKVVRSVMEQVDFLTTMLSVVNAEHMDTMKKFIIDPVNNPPPSMKPASIKEYKEVVDTLHKLVAGATGDNKKSSALYSAIADPPTPKALPESIDDEEDSSILLASVVDG